MTNTSLHKQLGCGCDQAYSSASPSASMKSRSSSESTSNSEYKSTQQVSTPTLRQGYEYMHKRMTRISCKVEFCRKLSCTHAWFNLCKVVYVNDIGNKNGCPNFTVAGHPVHDNPRHIAEPIFQNRAYTAHSLTRNKHATHASCCD